MLIDLLDSSNYIMVNRDAIRILGLNTAVYCAELLNIYKKAMNKDKVFNQTYFVVDRDYIAKRTSIDIEEQLKCDANLAKVKIITTDKDNPDMICLDVEVFASILSSEDVKLLDHVSDKVKVANPKGVKKAQRDRIINELKNNIECNDIDILFAIKGWIDAIMADQSKCLSTVQVRLFKDTLDDYCNGDKKAALDIINLAAVHQYVDCQWAINLYARDNKPVISARQIYKPFQASRMTLQPIATELGDRKF